MLLLQEAPSAPGTCGPLEAPSPSVSTARLHTHVPLVIRDVAKSIRDDIPEYRDQQQGEVAVDVQRVVARAVTLFGRLADDDLGFPAWLPAEHAEAYRGLGTDEAEAGRGKQALLGAYRVATFTALRTLEASPELPRNISRGLRSSICRYGEHLSGLAGEGHDDGIALHADRDRARARLARALLLPYGVSTTVRHRLADAADWPLPEEATVVELRGGGDIDQPALCAVARTALGARALAASINGRTLVVVPDDVEPEVMRRALAKNCPSNARASVGCRTPIEHLIDSARWALQIASFIDSGRLPAARFVDSEEHLAALLQAADEPLGHILVQRRLAPLLRLGPKSRLTYGELASALLEVGRHGHAPGVLDVPKSTLQYRIDRLHDLFGEDWEERDARVEMMFALRTVLPRWRSEAHYAQNHRRARTSPRRSKVGPVDQGRARSSSDPP